MSPRLPPTRVGGSQRGSRRIPCKALRASETSPGFNLLQHTQERNFQLSISRSGPPPRRRVTWRSAWQGPPMRQKNLKPWISFHWYLDKYWALGWPKALTRLNLNIPVPPRVPADLSLSGQVARVDFVPSGGYAGWIFVSGTAAGWRQGLRMPLVQGGLGTGDECDDPPRSWSGSTLSRIGLLSKPATPQPR